MELSLQGLPIELIECIVTFLELRDISSLRLTSRALEGKASQGTFTVFFKHKNVELTTRTMQDMVRVITRGRRLGCFLQHCTITGIVRQYDDTRTTLAIADEGPTERHHLQRLLTEAFRNLKQQHGPEGGLASLCFRIDARNKEAADGELTTTEPDEFRGWRAVWEAARRTFNVTMAALNDSQLRVYEHLDVFGSLKGCSLACDTFLAIAQETAARPFFASLKRLTVSLSAPPPPPEAPSEYQTDEEADFFSSDFETESRHSHLILQDIMPVLRIMPELESLKLHWYNLGGIVSTSPVTSSTAPCDINLSSAFTTCLKECSLQGLHVSETRLLQFLKAVHPTSLTLTYISLVSGACAPIFEYLTDPDTPITYVHLDDILERTALVHFDIPGIPKFPYQERDMGPSTLTRQGSHYVKEGPIRYRFASRRALGSGQRMYWLRSKGRDFGPLNWHRYDFVMWNSQSVAKEDEARRMPYAVEYPN